MMKDTIAIFLSLIACLSYHHPGTAGYKILIASPPAGSHLLGKITIGKALVARGHEVHLVISERYPKLDSFIKAGIKPILYAAPNDSVQIDSEFGLRLVTETVFSGQNPQEMGKKVSGILHQECEYMMADKEMLEKVKRMNFDVGIAESFILCPCSTILPVYIGKPLITMGSLFSYWGIRMPALPSFVNPFGAPLILDKLHEHTMWNKLKALLGFIFVMNPGFVFPGQKTDLIAKYTPQYSSWGEILRESQLFLTETDHRLGSMVPAFPNYINVAGMTASPAKPLPADLEKIMADSGDDGVVVVSFGSTAYYMPSETVRKFFDGFSRINQTVLARFKAPDGIAVPKNVKLLSWLPQNDLLGHPKTRLFITHCGNSGQYEALYHAVPMIGMPWFAEQHSNCERSADRGFGVTLDILSFTSDQLSSAIQEVVYNKRYKQTIGKVSEAWMDELRIESTLDRATYWIEHIIKYGGRHLRSPAMELSLFEFLMLDVLLVVLLSICAFFSMAVIVVKLVCRKLCCKKFTSKKVKTN